MSDQHPAVETPGSPESDKAPLVSVCILDNDSPLLLSSLMSVLKAFESAPGTTFELTVLSLSSRVSFALDDAVRRYPDLRIVVLPWFTHRVDMLNYAVRKATAKFILFLDSDVFLNPNFFVRFKPYGEKVNLFGLSFDVRTISDPRVFQTADFDAPADSSAAASEFGKTAFAPDLLGIDARPGLAAPAPSLFTFSGIGCFRRDALLKLNGFDPAFKFLAYGFCADLDLCYRAWQAGYGTLFAPELKVWRRGLRNAGSFYNPMPVSSREPFFDRFAWNVLYRFFTLRARVPVPVREFAAATVRTFDILGLMTLLFAWIMKLVHRTRAADLKPFYGFEKIKDITSRDVL